MRNSRARQISVCYSFPFQSIQLGEGDKERSLKDSSSFLPINLVLTSWPLPVPPTVLCHPHNIPIVYYHLPLATTSRRGMQQWMGSTDRPVFGPSTICYLICFMGFFPCYQLFIGFWKKEYFFFKEWKKSATWDHCVSLQGWPGVKETCFY